MLLQLNRPLRASFAALALAAYSVPLVVGLAAQIGHGAEHALLLIQDLERQAEAMGVAHLHDLSDRGTYVHAHGGAPHAHDAGVGHLLTTSEQAEEPHDGIGPTPPQLSIHLPAPSPSWPLGLAARAATEAEPDSGFPRSLFPPPLPPPRV